MVKPFSEWTDEEIEKTRQTALQVARVQRVLDEAARSSRVFDALFASDGPPTRHGERAADPAPLEREREAPAQAQPAVAAAPLPLTTGDIAFCFDGLRYTEAKWKKPLGNKPKWLAACVATPGRRGVCETKWNPVLIGGALVRRGHVLARTVRAKFQTQPMLKPWLDEWKTYEADYIESA